MPKYLKKYISVFCLLVTLLIPNFVFAAEISADTMILDWKTQKVWKDGDNLCISGTFENLRDDLKVTKINDFTVLVTFTQKDGKKYQVVRQPEKIPMCKIAPNSSKKVVFNLGKFDGEWSSWNTEQYYTFFYINGASF